jgi:Asp-tRNA(Asn)/Glu-tRNA(Gln) amidotransferase A subunit family amidase
VDAGIVFDAMRGDDGLDPSARNTAFAWQPGSDITQLRVGILRVKNWPARNCDKAFIQWLKKQTKELVEVNLPEADYGSMLVMLQAEAAAAFDELTRSGRDDQLSGQRANDWPNQFRAARTIPAVEYIQASRLRQKLVQDMHTSLANIDVLITPTHSGPTLTATNLSGHPTYVLPVGRNELKQNGGRPMMLSLVGQLDGEGPLLALAEAWQQATDWHLTRPSLTNA